MTFFINGPETMPTIKANAPAVDLPTWGQGLGAGIASAQLETDSNFVADRRRQDVKSGIALDVARRIGGDVLSQRMKDAGMSESLASTFETMTKRGFKQLSPELQDFVFAEALKEAAINPEAWADVDFSEDTIDAQTNEKLRLEYQDAQQILEMMPSGRGSAEFVGGMAGMTVDVKNLPFLAMGGGSGSIVRVMGREAAINMAAEGVFLPSQFEMAERLDIPDPNVVSQLAMAAGAGAVLGGGLTAAQRGWSYFKGRNQTPSIGRMDSVQTQAMIDRVEDILTSDTSQPFAQIDELVAEAGEDMNPPPYRLENPINPERPQLLPTATPEITTTPLDAIDVDADVPAPKKPAGKRPKSLKSFVVDEGGIWKGDEGGDVSAIEYRRPGFLKKNKRVDSTAGNNEGGLTLDDMRSRAVEDGYLPEGATINDLLDALDGDVRGSTRTYSQRDGMLAAEWDDFDGITRENPSQNDAPNDFQSAVEEYEAMRPSPTYIDRELMDMLPDAEAEIQNTFNTWVQESGWSNFLTANEKDEILSVLQERGGDPDLLTEMVIGRELDYAEIPEFQGRDAPFNPNDPRAELPGQGAGVAGQPRSQPGEARDSRTGGSDGKSSARASESTVAGDQTLIDGVTPVTTRERLQSQQDAPLRGGDAAADDGLFDVGSRSQADMFSDPTSPEARAMQDTVAQDMRGDIEADGDFNLDIETPDGGTRVMSANDLLNYLDEGDAFSARIDLCGKGPT